jgi:hypothetical protein
MRYKIKKRYGKNLLGQKYTKKWYLIDTKTGITLDRGDRDNLGRANRELKRLNLEHNKEQKVLSENQEIADEYGIKKIGDKWVDARGNEHDTVEGAIAGATRYDVATEELETKSDEYKTAITEAGAEKEKLAQGLSARRSGELVSQIKNLLQGRDPSQVAALEGRMKGATQRGLGDILKDISAGTKGQLAEAEKFDITSGMNLEQIDISKQSLVDAMTQFYSGQELERDKFQATLDAQPEWYEGALSSIGQGAGSAGGAYLTNLLLASDRRLKKNIEKIGKESNGLNVYSFSYIWDNEVHTGYMSDEVRQLYPDAVTVVNGYDMVNYGIL